MAANTSFGEWLRQRRHLLDMTQVQLADLTGCSAVTIRKLEANERKPSVEMAEALAVTLRIPEREQMAFVQFARSDDMKATFRLPAWNPQELTWRTSQLPTQTYPDTGDTSDNVLQYDLVATEPPVYQNVTNGRQLVNLQARGSVSGYIEGEMVVRLTQIIMPKPAGMDYSQALPMQVGAIFKIRSGEEMIEGYYSGSISTILDAAGHGTGRVQATGQIISVTADFADLFLNYVFVTDVVKMVEGIGTGSKGTMQIKPAI